MVLLNNGGSQLVGGKVCNQSYSHGGYIPGRRTDKLHVQRQPGSEIHHR